MIWLKRCRLSYGVFLFKQLSTEKHLQNILYNKTKDVILWFYLDSLYTDKTLATFYPEFLNTENVFMGFYLESLGYTRVAGIKKPLPFLGGVWGIRRIE